MDFAKGSMECRMKIRSPRGLSSGAVKLPQHSVAAIRSRDRSRHSSVSDSLEHLLFQNGFRDRLCPLDWQERPASMMLSAGLLLPGQLRPRYTAETPLEQRFQRLPGFGLPRFRRTLCKWL